MKEVKNPKKPLAYYYSITLIALLLFNIFVAPLLNRQHVEQTDYSTFMRMIAEKKIGKVDVSDTEIIFTDKDDNTIYVTGVMYDPTLTQRLYDSGAEFAKDIEQTMSPVLSYLLTLILPLVIFVIFGQFMRKKLMDQVTKAVKAIGYVGVGTLEFLLDRDGRFWFMEMNLRLQVEHGVTEMLTKIDLVKWQIRVAAGVPLNFRQQDVSLSGACLECRINATRPGTLTMLHVPGGPFVRFDTYLVAGTTVSPYYDSLLGKLIVYAGTREEALRKMKAALCELMVEGIETNIAEQLDLVSRPDFMDGSYDLTFLEGE